MIDDVLAAWPGHKKTGPNTYKGPCLAHDDRNPSLDVTVADGGRVLVCCRSHGCTFDAIAKAMGLPKSAFFPENGQAANGHAGANGKSKGGKVHETLELAINAAVWSVGQDYPGAKLESTFAYRDVAGQIVGLSIRVKLPLGSDKTKEFRAIKVVVGGYRVQAPDIWPMFNLPEILATPDAIVFLNEGEKKADAMMLLGLLATSSAQGANGAKKTDWSTLAGRTVAIIPDNDEPGEEYAASVKPKLLAIGCKVKILRLPNLGHKEDVVDFIERRREDGKDDSEIRREIEDLTAQAEFVEPATQMAPPPIAPPITKATESDEPMLLTDMGNAKRFARDHGKTLRFCHPWNCWLVWDGRRWLKDDTGRVKLLAKETLMAFYHWAKEQVEALAGDSSADGKARLAKIMKVLEWTLKSQDAKRINAMLDLAKSEPGIPVLPSQFDRDPMVLNVANGTLDLKTGTLRRHNQADLLAKLCPVAFNPAATCPAFTRTLTTILNRDADLIEYVKLFLGYCLTGDTREHAVPIAFGNGSNGKTLLLKLILNVLGSDYAGMVAPELLVDHKGDQHPTIKADLFGKRLMVAAETKEGARLNEERVKALSGSDSVKARRMHEDYWSFEPTHKLILMTNHRPEVRGDDHGIWRRLALWPFTVRFWDPDKRESGAADLRADKTLLQKLTAEHEGVLQWMVAGCLAWQRHGMPMPTAVRDATAEYRSDEDRLGGFLAAMCTVNAEIRVKKSELYSAFREWCKVNGDRELSGKAFGNAVAERGFTQDAGRRWYLGLAIIAGDQN